MTAGPNHTNGGRAAAGRPPSLAGFSLLDADFQRDPEAYFSLMRRERPVFPTEVDGQAVWLVTTDALCREVVSDPATYSSRFSLQPRPGPELAERVAALQAELGAYPRVRTLIVADPPSHDRFRRLVGSAFTPRAITKWQDAFTTLAHSLAEGFGSAQRLDFRNEFALPMSVRSVALILDLPEAMLDRFSAWSDSTIVGLGTTVTDEEFLAAQRANIEFQHYFADLIEQRRAHPTDDLTTRLVTARLPADPASDGAEAALSDAEILDLLQSVVAAANHTTTTALSEMMLHLAESPRWWDRACRDRESWPRIIEESVRLASPANGLWRVATRETELGGVTIPARGKIFVSFASANRDESVYDGHGTFDPDTRGTASHLAWGRGIHSCLGQNMARAEMRSALEALGTRLATVALTPGFTPEYIPNYVRRGLTSLTVDVTYR